MQKLISVIIPIYNVEKYLERCVKSIVYQTYHNIEIILVNDGSTDNSGVLCDKLKSTYSRIKVIHKENGGLSDARNAGIEIAKGDYLTFIDSDDYIHMQTLETQMDMLEFYCADLSEIEYQKVWADHKVDWKYDSAKIVVMDSKEAFFANLREQYFRNLACTKLYKRELIGDIRFPKGKLHEDVFFTYKILHKAQKLVHICLPMYYYQQRESSIMGQNLSIKNLDAAEGFKERLAFFEKTDTEIYEKAYEAYIRFLFYRLNQIALYDKRTMKEKKEVFNAYANEILLLDKNMLSRYYITRKNKYSMLILKISRDLYRMLFISYHKKYQRKSKTAVRKK